MRPLPRIEAGGGLDGRRPGPLFRDRRDAGRELGERLRLWAAAHPVILGLPRGGVPVAYEVARALDAPLDVIVARKIGAPDDPELGIGAEAEDGVRVLNAGAVQALELTADDLQRGARRAADEVNRRVALYRGYRGSIPLAGRTAIVVDDGLATGVTALAAVRAVDGRGPRTLVLAVPVGAAATVAALAREVDHVTCLATPERLGAVCEYYEDFAPTSDGEAIRLLIDRDRECRSVREHADFHRAPRPSADAR
jgi:predicted phosphoribosyltransferase